MPVEPKTIVRLYGNLLCPTDLYPHDRNDAVLSPTRDNPVGFLSLFETRTTRPTV